MANLRVDKITSTETFERTGSVQFDGSTTSIRAGWVDDYNYLHHGTEDWTAECWVYPQVVNSRQTIFSTGGNSSAHGFCVRIMEQGISGSSNGYYVSAQMSRGSGGNYIYWSSDPKKLEADKWYHIAVVFRSSNKSLEIYVDGELTNGKGDTGYVEGTFTTYSSSNAHSGLMLGHEPYGSSLKLTGFISNFRIVQGKLVYTENFKVPMKELEDISGTTLLCCQSKTSAAAAKISPFISGVNDGTIWSDALDVTNGTRLRHTDFGDGSIQEPAKIFDARDDTDAEGPNGTNNSIIFDFETLLGKKIPVSSSIKIKIGGSDGRTLKVNGTTIATNAGPTESVITNQSTLNKVEVVAESSARSGRLAYIKVDDVSLTLPVLPFGKVVHSELSPGLLTDKVIDGGNSAIKGSVEFSGSSYEYLSTESTDDFTFALNDFTVEFYVNPSSLHTYHQIFDTRGTVGNSLTGFSIGYTTANFYFYTNGFLIQSSHPGLNSWSHIALTRKSGIFYLFINGINSGSYNASTYNLTNSTVYIGATGTSDTTQFFKGFISNLRVVKGTALYTHDFIPPTRELKKIPGTVLLCCQDPDNPLTEATGKTITGYGDLHEATDVEMLTNGSFAGGYSTEWEAKNNANLSHSNGKLTVTSTQNYSGVRVKSAYLPSLVAGRKYVMTIDLESITNPIRFGVVSGLTVNNISTAGRHSGIFTASAVTEIFIEKPDGSNSTFVLKSVSIREAETPNRASNFTPQVGDNRKVTFEGVTKINSDAYFYLPTGDTVTRESRSGYGNRGLFSLSAAPAASNIIEFVNISSTGNAQDFGDLKYKNDGSNASCSSSTRGIFAGGRENPSPGGNIDHINYVTIASTGDAEDFGNLTEARRGITGYGSGIRGMFAGGRADPGGSNPTDVIDFITIASTGNAIDFGNMSEARRYLGSTSSPVRGVMAGGHTGSRVNTMDYVSIPSKGNAIDFGNLTQSRDQIEGNSNGVRGIFGGGSEHPTYYNIIDYVTIASTGDAQDFGDLLGTTGDCATASNCIRGVFAGGNNPTKQNVIQYVSISSMGNALNFGDLTAAASEGSGCSDSHGGLG